MVALNWFQIAVSPYLEKVVARVLAAPTDFGASATVLVMGRMKVAFLGTDGAGRRTRFSATSSSRFRDDDQEVLGQQSGSKRLKSASLNQAESKRERAEKPHE